MERLSTSRRRTLDEAHHLRVGEWLRPREGGIPVATRGPGIFAKPILYWALEVVNLDQECLLNPPCGGNDDSSNVMLLERLFQAQELFYHRNQE